MHSFREAEVAGRLRIQMERCGWVLQSVGVSGDTLIAYTFRSPSQPEERPTEFEGYAVEVVEVGRVLPAGG